MSFLGNLFGGNDAPQINYTPSGFNAGGLNATFSGNNYNIAPSDARTSAVGQIASTFASQNQQLGALRAGVQPGFSAFRQAGMATLQNQQAAGIGNLRDSLAQRRILGSSFASDAITRANLDYAQQQANFQAQSYLQELQANQQLIQQQYTAARGQFQTGLDELNLEAGLAADLTGRASQSMASIAQANAQLQAQSQAGAGQFLGTLLGLKNDSLGGTMLGNIGSGIGNIATTALAFL